MFSLQGCDAWAVVVVCYVVGCVEHGVVGFMYGRFGSACDEGCVFVRVVDDAFEVAAVDVEPECAMVFYECASCECVYVFTSVLSDPCVSARLHYPFDVA